MWKQGRWGFLLPQTAGSLDRVCSFRKAAYANVHCHMAPIGVGRKEPHLYQVLPNPYEPWHCKPQVEVEPIFQQAYVLQHRAQYGVGSPPRLRNGRGDSARLVRGRAESSL